MARAFRVLTALAAWTGLGIQLWLLLSDSDFGSPVWAIWRFLAYFTILTNVLVAVTASASAIAPASALGRFVATAQARAAVLLYIAVVAIVYHLVLAETWEPMGLQLTADQLLHTAIPALVALGWVFFDNKRGLSFSALPAMLVFPVGYALYALVRGGFDGFYPYPFIDVSEIGYARVLMNVAGLAGAFLAGGVVVIALGRMLAGPDRPPKRKWQS
ncbi:MAG: Pr6Pr family membrane protein [Hyphomonas sp.]